jgi:hypothetical protein
MLPKAWVDDWRTDVTEIFPEVQEVNESIATLLGDSGRSSSEEQTMIRDLKLTLTKLHVQLPVLYQHVSGPFLSAL